MAYKKFRREVNKVLNPPSKRLYGELGYKYGNKAIVQVPNRDGYVYVRLRSNTNEVVQAYNEKLPIGNYDVPVELERQGNRYVILGRDNQRYAQWESQSPTRQNVHFVPPVISHGDMHSFTDDRVVGGGDIAFIYSRQFRPLLTSPYNEVSPNLYIAPHTIRKADGTWAYVGNTGTVNLCNYSPTSGTVVGIVGIDVTTGNPKAIINSGTYIAGLVTGVAQLLPHLPTMPDPSDFIPLTMVRLQPNLGALAWGHLYDVRQFFSEKEMLNVQGYEPVNKITFNNASVTYAGKEATVEVSSGGGSGNGNNSNIFSVKNSLATGSNVAQPYFVTNEMYVDTIYLVGGTLGVTGSLTVDINVFRSGTMSTIFTNQANRPSLPYNSTTKFVSTNPDIRLFHNGDILTLDIDNVGAGFLDLSVAALASGSITSVTTLAIPHINVKSLAGASPSKTMTSATFVDFDTTIDIIYNKIFDSSNLVIDMAWTVTNTIATTTAEFGVNIDGVDYAVTKFTWADTIRKGFSGYISVSGLSAGTHTIRPRWRRVSGSGTLGFDSAANFSYKATEAYP